MPLSMSTNLGTEPARRHRDDPWWVLIVLQVLWRFRRSHTTNRYAGPVSLDAARAPLVSVSVIGYARSLMSDDEFRSRMSAAVLRDGSAADTGHIGPARPAHLLAPRQTTSMDGGSCGGELRIQYDHCQGREFPIEAVTDFAG